MFIAATVLGLLSAILFLLPLLKPDVDAKVPVVAGLLAAVGVCLLGLGLGKF